MATGVIQNDPEYFPKTKEFIPERWIKGDPLYEKTKMNGNNPFVYQPFGFGPRSCIGRRFAEMEILVMLSRYGTYGTSTHTHSQLQTIEFKIKKKCFFFFISID